MSRPFLFSMMLLSFFTIGCTHNLRITNLPDYFSSPPSALKQPLRLGVTSSSDAHIQNSRYVTAVVDALQRTGSFGRVLHPYNASVHQDQVDVVIDVTVNPTYKGRGSNFFVNWPGFIIFAPAIWGYGYIAEIDTRVNITKLKDNNTQQLTIPTTYKFRQAEFDRTWTEIGWLEVGLIPLIGGIVFTGYDPDVTDEFIREVSPNYGPYVAGKILEALAQ